MFMKTKNEPKKVDLTEEQAESLKQRLLAAQDLPEQDKEILLGLVSFNFWLRNQLSLAKINIRRLKRLFGFRREKKSLKIPMM
jgi:hypothetical protein